MCLWGGQKMTKDTALKMAIEALESAYGVLECEGMIPIGYESAIQACKEALEQEQSFAEKTAQMSFMSLWDAYTTLKMKLEALEQSAQKPVALIRHENGNFSPAPSWQGLSDDEMNKIADKCYTLQTSVSDYEFNEFEFARAIEQALKEKNT